MRHPERQRIWRLIFLYWTLHQAEGFQPDVVSSNSITRRGTSPRPLQNHQGLSWRQNNCNDNTITSWSLLSSAASSTPSSRINYREIGQEIVRLGRLGRSDEALDMYFDVDNPPIRLMNSAIDVCSRSRPTKLREAFEIFDDGVKTKNLKPNVFTFGALMNVCNRARNAEKATSLLRSMQVDYGVEPNSVVYSAAISACARSQPAKSGQAKQLLKEAVEDKQLQMNVVGFNAAISACAQAGDWESAIELLTRMEDAAADDGSSVFLIPQPDAISYGTVLAACERGQQWGLVLKYAQVMESKNLDLDGLAFTSCLHACQQLGQVDDALMYLEKMKSVNPTTAQTTARYQRSGAREPLRGPDEVAYRLAISACARGGAWEEGIRLLDEYRDYSGGKVADVVAYTAAITGCEYAGEWKEAFLLLDKMGKEGVEANAVTMAAVIGACATACAQQGKSNMDESGILAAQSKALKLLEVLKKDPNLVKPNIQIYNAAIRVCAEAQDMKRAFQLFEEIEDLDIERTEVTYGSLMTACERVGDVESASRVFRRLKEDGITPNEIIYGAAISCCRKARQSERALLLLRRMMKEELSPNVATLNTVLLAQVEGRSKADTERAILIYKLMKSRYVSDAGRPNRQTYNILINFFASMLQPLTAETFLQKMREDGIKPDVDLFTATVTAYERTRQPLKALQLMESMQQDGYDFYSVKVLNTAFKKAVELANKVGQSFSSTKQDILSKEEECGIKLISSKESVDDDFMQPNNNPQRSTY